jgi:hypothetical protein
MTINEQVRILAIFHYVVGGMQALFGCFGFIHLFIGVSFILNPDAWHTSPSDAPPQWFGIVFALVGGGVILLGWVLGFLTILSGRFISRRVHRTFSIVMGAVNCAMIPFGTVLGVFDIILLTKDELKMQYEAKP